MSTKKNKQSSNSIEDIFNQRKDLIYGYLEKDKRYIPTIAPIKKNEEDRTLSPPNLMKSCSST